MEISAKMGVLPEIEALATGTNRMTMHREGRRRPIEIDLTKIYAATSDRHVEIMRDDLSEIYYAAGRDDVEYLFGDSITAIDHDGEVTFEHAPARRFDVIVGADGLHSNVRQLTFGEEAGPHPVPRRLSGGGVGTQGAGRPRRDDRPRRRRPPRGDLHRRAPGRRARRFPVPHQTRTRLRLSGCGAAAGAIARRVRATCTSRWTAGWAKLDRTPAFYFDSITQLRLDSWSRRRVTLVGDAGYCPGPAVGGSTSLAVLGAYVLAGELARADGDHLRAFAAYELQMREPVHRSRAFARGAARGIIPGSRLGVWALTRGAQLVSLLPGSLSRSLAKLNAKGVRMHDSMPVPEYGEDDV